MEAIATWDSRVSSDDLLSFVATVPHGIKSSQSARSDCEKKLGIPKDIIDYEWKNRKSEELKTSITNYESVITKATRNEENSWLEYVPRLHILETGVG